MVIKRPLLAFLLIALLVSACGGPAGGPPDGPPLTDEQRQGRRIFVQNCASCHDPHAPLFEKRWPKTYSQPLDR